MENKSETEAGLSAGGPAFFASKIGFILKNYITALTIVSKRIILYMFE